jgi:16S rRNA (guanine(966)-N(2))-methyltransferase RsmD
MRIIAGEFRSRRLKTLPGLRTRPTPDRLRETLFDIIAPRIEGAVFVDAYAGTGSVGIEALSRGAREVVFIEKNRAAVDVIRQNLKALGAETRAQVICGKVAAALGRFKADIVFLDPPYDLDHEYGAALGILSETLPGIAIAQHTVRLPLAAEYGRLRRAREVRQGDNVLSFYAEADK